MLKILFVLLVVIHGLIHLLGFAKGWKLAEVKQLTGKTIFPLSDGICRFIGIWWLIASITFIVSAVVFMLSKEWWWMVAAFAVIISQFLIIVYWHDAKFGTLVNLIIFIISLLAYGQWNFNKMVTKEIDVLFINNHTEQKVVTTEMISKLPHIVQKWLKHSGVIGKDFIRTVHLNQEGELKLKVSGKWLPFNAEQYFNTVAPGFVWIVDLQFAPLINVVGRDKYVDGKGSMLIKLLSLYPIVNATGAEINESTLIRYLAELTWFPSAALSNYLSWEEIDSTTAKATMNYGGISASGNFIFNSEGDLTSFEALRYYDRKEGATLEKWFIQVAPDGYKEFEGIRIPAKSSVTWKLKDGDFTWLKLEITNVKFNKQYSGE
jgi:hypothetical protein